MVKSSFVKSVTGFPDLSVTTTLRTTRRVVTLIDEDVWGGDCANAANGIDRIMKSEIRLPHWRQALCIIEVKSLHEFDVLIVARVTAVFGFT